MSLQLVHSIAVSWLALPSMFLISLDMERGAWLTLD